MQQSSAAKSSTERQPSQHLISISKHSSPPYSSPPGGANPRRQKESLARNRPALVVGTPGRLAEMVRTGMLHLHRCGIMVIDEVRNGLEHSSLVAGCLWYYCFA